MRLIPLLAVVSVLLFACTPVNETVETSATFTLKSETTIGHYVKQEPGEKPEFMAIQTQTSSVSEEN